MKILRAKMRNKKYLKLLERIQLLEDMLDDDKENCEYYSKMYNKIIEFIDELKYNQEVNIKHHLDNRVDIEYVIDRLKYITHD